MESNSNAKELDIVIVVDSTGSMDPFLIALTRLLPQLLAIRALTISPSTSGISDILSHRQPKRIRRMGILTYRDYYPVPAQLYPSQISAIVHPIPANDQAAAALKPKLTVDDVLAWSGWDDPRLDDDAVTKGESRQTETKPTAPENQYLSEWVKGITAEGGGDYPEAAKTALRRLLDLVEAGSTQSSSPPSDHAKSTVTTDPSTKGHRSETVETVVLWYTDAPPHHRSHRGINRCLEIGAHGCVPSEKGWILQSDISSNPPTTIPPSAPTSDNLSQKKIETHPPQQLPPTVSMQPYLSKVNIATPIPPLIPASNCIDWVHLTKASVNAGLRVYTIIPPSMPDLDATFYAMLGAATSGGVFVIGGKERKKVNGDVKGKEKDGENKGDGSGWYNELMISGGAPFVKAVTTLSLEIVLALVGLEDPTAQLPDPLDEDLRMGDDGASSEMNISEPSEAGGHGAPRGRARGYYRRGHFYPPRGQRRRDGPSDRPFILRDADKDEEELQEMLAEEQEGIEVPVQWLSFEEDPTKVQPPVPTAPTTEPTSNAESNNDTSQEPPAGDGQEIDKDQPSTNPEAQPEAQPQCALIRILDEDNSLGYLPYPWRGLASGIDLYHKRILRENVEGVQLTRRIVASDERRQARAEITGDLKEKNGEDDETQMPMSIYTEGGKAPSETISFLLKRVVDVDVEIITRVWIFSEIWGAVSKQPSTDAQQSLFALFSEKVENIKSEGLKQRFKKWAAINHDASAEITQLLEKTSVNETENLVLSLDEGAVAQSGLRKEDVLDLTRSCDKKLLKKMGYLLRYTKAIPSSKAIVDNQHQISLTTTAPETVFRVLPHLAFEGVMYTPRTAAILATVATTSHIPHLLKPAQLLLESAKGSWLSSLTPENFTPAFMRFVVSLSSTSRDLMLSSEERDTYEGMTRYMILEENLDTKLQGLVPWTPMKTRGVGDRKKVCEGCGVRRSETMMHQVGSQIKKRRYTGIDGKKEDTLEEVSGMRCGMCVDSDNKRPQDWKDQGDIQSCWVECSERWCRAQYVIEDEEGLRIPPRCYYCRKRRPCPWIECTKCNNRIILPKSYRVSPGDSPSNFTCPPCQNQSYTGHQTIVHKLTTLRSILFANEYEVEWLGVKPFKEIFRGRSTFMIWELYGGGIFGAVTPSSSPPGTPPTSSPPISPVSGSEKRDKGGKDNKKRLELYGKRLLNPSGLREELNGIVDRAMKKDHVLCGLTYELVQPEELVKACADTRTVEDGGCAFFASVRGLREWYSGDGERRQQCPACRGFGKTI